MPIAKQKDEHIQVLRKISSEFGDEQKYKLILNSAGGIGQTQCVNASLAIRERNTSDTAGIL